ncbi:MAG: MarR family transcriptional regulator [Calditrichaeota bacterium]|nr:MAG: MarR family transcriptional regulator [Calditrichota bacterium]
MTDQNLEYEMANTIFLLRQKCYTKDMYFVRSFNITMAEYNCLVIFFSKEIYAIKDLAKALDITPGGVTRIITSLEKKGIVKRRIGVEDRRRIDVQLTKKGRDMVDKLRQTSMEMHGKILSRLEEPHREPVLNALRQLTEAIDAWVEEHNHK